MRNFCFIVFTISFVGGVFFQDASFLSKFSILTMATVLALMIYWKTFELGTKDGIEYSFKRFFGILRPHLQHHSNDNELNVECVWLHGYFREDSQSRCIISVNNTPQENLDFLSEAVRATSTAH